MTNYTQEWICTDPDTKQYGRQLHEMLFEFKQGDGQPHGIDISGYKNAEIEQVINTYGYTLFTKTDKPFGLQNIHIVFGDHANFMIAEYMFEDEMQETATPPKEEKEELYLVYSTDAWHTRGSEVLIGVCSSRKKAVDMISPLPEQREQLRNGDQTQGCNTCYEIRTCEVDKLI